MKKIWEIVKKWSWWTWSVIIIGILIGISASFYYDQFFKQPSLFSQITSEINVLDVHESLRDLQITFQGDNIQEKSLNLRIYRVKIDNNGGTNITQNDFDQNDNWGIRVEKGRIIETRLIDSNSKYVNANLSPHIQDNNLVKFNKIIFDKGDFFIIELLVLHDKDTPPVLYQIGKIAGIQENEYKILSVEHSESFLAALFHGNWLINIVRSILYFIVSVIIFLALLLLISQWIEERKKKAQNPQPPQQPN